MIHNHEVTGSIPVPATKDVLFGRTNLIGAIFFAHTTPFFEAAGIAFHQSILGCQGVWSRPVRCSSSFGATTTI